MLDKLIKKYGIVLVILYGAILVETFLCIILYIVLLKVRGVL
jgi:hypothetical protein